MKHLRNAALEYADLGWKVLPLQPRAKAPLGALVPSGFRDATDDLVQVLRWWTAAPEANVGIACGASGMAVLDIDPRHGGDDALFDLEDQLGELPETVESHSGGGGVHLLFRHPGGALMGQAAPGVDVKDHGYIAAPPSIHPSGGVYEWSVDGHPEDVPMAELPERWLQRLRRAARANAPTGVNRDHDDPLRRVPSINYARALTGRDAKTGHQGVAWMRCPFHGDGGERTPSMKLEGTLWSCFGCSPILGKHVMGGNIYDFAGLLKGLPLPLRGIDFAEVKDGLMARL